MAEGKHKKSDIPSPEDSWARVELWRWQHGRLPSPDDKEELDESEGLRNMAAALEQGCRGGDTSAMPSPQNVCAVMNYAARRLEALNSKNKG